MSEAFAAAQAGAPGRGGGASPAGGARFAS
jgi:hypothetical protein